MTTTRPLRAIKPLLLAALCFGLAGPTATLAAPAPFPTVTTPVKLDGHLLASQDYEYLNTIVYDSGTYHLWYLDATLSIIKHATSSDGVNFSFQNDLTLPANWWTAYGASVQPWFNYLRVSRDGSGNWILMIWHPSDSGQGQFNYNTSLWLLGGSIANASPTLIGPLPTLSTSPIGPGGNHVGPLGIVGSNLYLVQDTAKAFGRYALTTPIATTVPPGTSPAGMVDAADAYAGTPWCSWADGGCASADRSYVHNYGRTLDQGGGVLGTYYSLRNYNDWSRRGKQLWYLESTDGGTNWSTSAQGLFTNGDAVTVDGLPNTGNFSSPEVTALGGGQYRSYFNTFDACGNNVVVTAPLSGTQQGLTVSKTFSPSVVQPGGTSTLTITLTAPAASCTPAPTTPVFTGLGFTDTLPNNMAVAATPNFSSSCTGATFAPVGGAQSFTLSGASLAPGASCTATVDVTVTGAGTFRNTIAATAVSNDQGVPALADAVADLRAGSTPAAVPTLGEYAMALLALLLTGLGWRRLSSAGHREG